MLLFKGKTGQAANYLRQGRELDPGATQAEIDLGIELNYREQFNAAIENSDCQAAATFCKEILAVVPDDTEVSNALVAGRKGNRVSSAQ